LYVILAERRIVDLIRYDPFKYFNQY